MLLVSVVQQSESAVYVCVYLHSFSDSFPIQVIIEYWVECSVPNILYSRSLLAIYFIYG